MSQRRLLKSLTGGLSGCKLTISPDGKSVRKVSSDKGYNHRLINQIKKQSEFRMMDISGMQCPLITETGRDEYDLEYFIMEFEDTIFEGFYKHQMDLWNANNTNEILKSKAASRLKSTQYWPTDDIHTNESGFNALPSGFVNAAFVFSEKGQAAYFWTSSLYDDLGIAFTIKSRNGEVLTYYNEYGNGYAVRCYEGEPEPSE